MAWTKPTRQFNDLNLYLITGFVLRMFMVAYAVFHDATSDVKYTDVDYHIVTDASREILSGGSPYNRHTYRYTPLLSILLLPNVTIYAQFGKILFSLLDCMVAKLIYSIVSIDGHSAKVAGYASLLWLYNPIVIAISTRGSSDCVVAALVMCFIYYVKMRLPMICGLFLGFAVHFKIYPLIYVLPAYLSFTKYYKTNSVRAKFWPSVSKIRFLCALFTGFVVPTLLSYFVYGDRYLQESFLYHFSRRDTRHNFSLYFYVLYLCTDCDSLIILALTFVPQAICIFAVGLKYASHADLSFALFLVTYFFVVFNKVVTSQYFVWYLVILPLVAPQLKLGPKKALFLFSLWIFAQGSWLLPAYLLEFHGLNTFLPLWLESIAFFCSNVGIAISLIRAYNSKNLSGTDGFARKMYR